MSNKEVVSLEDAFMVKTHGEKESTRKGVDPDSSKEFSGVKQRSYKS